MVGEYAVRAGTVRQRDGFYLTPELSGDPVMEARMSFGSRERRTHLR